MTDRRGRSSDTAMNQRGWLHAQGNNGDSVVGSEVAGFSTHVAEAGIIPRSVFKVLEENIGELVEVLLRHNDLMTS